MHRKITLQCHAEASFAPGLPSIIISYHLSSREYTDLQPSEDKNKINVHTLCAIQRALRTLDHLLT